MADTSDNESFLVFKTRAHRGIIGLLGILFPFALAFGGWYFYREQIQSSLSDYYHTAMRDVFVGTLFAIGAFLLSYKGYNACDNVAGHFACLFAVGLALFPVSGPSSPPGHAELFGYIHKASATLFFLMLILFSLFLFTKTDPNSQPTAEKLKRNRVYRICGYTMLVSIVLIAVYFFLPETWAKPLRPAKPVFWLETVAVVAFGISWFTKSEAILRDKP